MATITGYLSPAVVFSGTLDAALAQGFITENVLTSIQSFTPEFLGMAAETWEPITSIALFESAHQGAPL